MDLETRTKKLTSEAWGWLGIVDGIHAWIWRLSQLTIECAENKFLDVSNDP